MGIRKTLFTGGLSLKNQLIQLDEGKYIVHVQAIKKETEEASAMAPYLSENAIITKEAEKTFITLMIHQEEVVTGFQVANEEGKLIESIDQQIDKQSKNRYEVFQLDILSELLQAR